MLCNPLRFHINHNQPVLVFIDFRYIKKQNKTDLDAFFFYLDIFQNILKDMRVSSW